MFSIYCAYNHHPSGAVSILLNPKDEIVISSPKAANVPQNANVDEGLAATAPPFRSAVKEEERPDAAVPLPAVKEVDANPPATVPLQSMVKEEDRKPVAAIPLSPSMVKKEDKKSVTAVPLSRSAATGDEKPVASTPPPRSAAVENIPKQRQSQNAHTGERPTKKLKLTQEATVKGTTPATTEKRPVELPSRQAVCYLIYFFIRCFQSANILLFHLILGLSKKHNCIFLNCPTPSFVHAYIFPDPCLFILWSLNERWDEEATNAVNSTNSVMHMIIFCCFPLIHYSTIVIFLNF
jgi:hypothetical protein